jgi:hypothetical protein
MKCLLCQSDATHPLRQTPQFYRCENCASVFRSRAFLLSSELEKERYLQHENDVLDEGYQSFVRPLVSAVTSSFPPTSFGLDFGAGPAPVAANLLQKNGYNLIFWDPFFHPNKVVLDRNYDFIICCETMEHFYNPLEEFQLMRQLLKPNGKLFCMTHLLPEMNAFKDWYYKNDKTHVIFYSEENLNWLQKAVGFSEVQIEDRIITFSR